MQRDLSQYAGKDGCLLSTYISCTYYCIKANDFSNIINLDKARFSVAVHITLNAVFFLHLLYVRENIYYINEAAYLAAASLKD